MLLLLTLPLALATEVIVDDQDGAPGFTTTGDDWTTWGMSGHGFDSGDTSYHYLSHTVGGSDRKGTATWTPDLPVAGTYAVSTWFRLTENRTSDADFTVTDGNGATTRTSLDQRGDGPSGWVDLATVWCAAGSGGCTVTLDGTDDDASDEANAVRFVLVEEDADGGDDGGIDGCGDTEQPGPATRSWPATWADGDDWSEVARATGEADDREASSPNVDAGEVLRAGGWEVCDPDGDEQIEAVRLGVRARMQYDSGTYALELALSAGGAAETVFSQTDLDWVWVDLSGERDTWSWTDVAALEASLALHDHPGGARDSDAWVDAFALEVDYRVPEQGGDDDVEEGAGPGDTGQVADSDAGDTGDTGAHDRGSAGRQPRARESDSSGCGSGTAALVLLGVFGLGGRRRLSRR